MKHIRIDEQGDEEVMLYVEGALPEVPAGSVRVRVEAIGVNMIDIYQRSGQYKMALPFTPGQEAAGVVDAVGDGVSDFQIGDRVAYPFALGAYAEYAVVPAAKLVPLPAGVSSRIAAAVLLQGMTAHYLLTDTYRVGSSDSVLIHAAAGGTGQLLVQIAKLKGARVLATTSTEEKRRSPAQPGRMSWCCTVTSRRWSRRRRAGAASMSSTTRSAGTRSSAAWVACARAG